MTQHISDSIFDDNSASGTAAKDGSGDSGLDIDRGGGAPLEGGHSNRAGVASVQDTADNDAQPGGYRIYSAASGQSGLPPKSGGTDGSSAMSAGGSPPITVSADPFSLGFGGDTGSGSGASVIDFSGGNSAGGGGKPGGGGGKQGFTQIYGTSGGLQFVINYDSGVNSAPSGFVPAFGTAINYFLTTFNNPITVTLNVGWGEVAGQSLSPFALGESSTNLDPVGYLGYRAALAAKAAIAPTDADLQSAVASLPATSPISLANYWVSTADEKALGLTANNTTVDGAVGFGSRLSYWFGTGAQTSSQYDFVGVAEHEISEVMGRLDLLGTSLGGVANSYDPLDLFRYSAPGTRSIVGGQTAYLSFDGGNTTPMSPGGLLYFNTQAGGDTGDWSSSGTTSAGLDAYDAFANSGAAYHVSHADTREMNVLGYVLAPPILAA
jgi:hypothetical protein